MRLLLALSLVTLALALAGVAGCPTTDDGAPDYAPAEFAAEDFVRVLGVAEAANDIAAYYAVRDRDFDGCMATAGIASGIEGATLYAPLIEGEALEPDGVLELPGYQFDGTACGAFLPDPWPPTEPDPALGAIVGPMISSSLGMASMMVLTQAPAEGEACVRAHVAAAILDAIGVQTAAILDEAMVSADLVLPIAAFSVDYSGCGI